MNSLEEIALQITEDINLKYSDLNGDDLIPFVTELARRLVAALGAQQRPVGKVVGFFEDNSMPRVAWYDAYPQKNSELFAAPVLPSVPEFTDFDLTRIYNEANGIGEGKSPPITTQRIFAAMRAMTTATPSPQEDAK